VSTEGHWHDTPPHHDHDHDHDHDHGPVHGWAGRVWHAVSHLVTPHSHDTADKIDAAMEASREGIRVLWLSLAVLAATAATQVTVVIWTHSVALLGDSLHNLADALTAVPLGVAFLVGRRAATRRYTYGYGRAEDLAGIFIVLLIAASSAAAGWQAINRLLHPATVTHLWAVAAAGIIGFIGNELVAWYRITTGRRIGSAALVADGLHARTDGFTSLAVVFGAGGLALGWRWADPVIGLVITVAILFVLKDAARQIYHRLMDAVDPDLVDQAETTLRGTPGVQDIGTVHLRWIGHSLRAECSLIVDPDLSVTQAHGIAVDAEHRLIHAIPRLGGALVHTDPQAHDGTDYHQALAHHSHA
jgi:cation diffusion facilitator family transporter